MERVLPEEFLQMWARLGELKQDREARTASRIAREEKQQAHKARQKKMEMKHLQNKNIVSISSDRIEELYRIVCSDRLSAVERDADACVPLDPSTVKQMKEVGCTDDHVHTAMLGLQHGGDLQAALDWLCMHLRDDELPAVLRQKHGGSSIRLKIASCQGVPQATGSSSGRGTRCLTRMGYSAEDADAALQLCAGSTDAVAGAWKRLFQVLARCELGDGAPADADALHCFGSAPGERVAQPVVEPQWPEPDSTVNPEAKAWWDEQYVIASIFPDEIVHASEGFVISQLLVPPRMVQAYSGGNVSSASPQHVAELAVVVWQGCGYPQTMPLVCVRCAALPPAVLLQLTASVTEHLQNECKGMEMLHEAHTHLKELLQAEPPSAIVASLRWSSIMRLGNGVDVNSEGEANLEAIAAAPKQAARHANTRRRRPAGPPPEHARRESERLARVMLDNSTMDPGRKMLAARQKLPAFGKRLEVLTAVADHRVIVISGATGCGKSTQVRSCSQRSIAAMSRVAMHEMPLFDR